MIDNVEKEKRKKREEEEEEGLKNFSTISKK